MLISLLLEQSEYIKMHQQEILPISRNVLKLFCAQLYTDYLSKIHKNFEIAFTHDTNTQCQI